MRYSIAKDGDTLTVTAWGYLDANSSPELEEALEGELDGIADFTIDLAHVPYISSSGLRLLLLWQKRMFKQGSLHVVGVSKEVMELFAETGFDEILDINE